MNKAGIDYGLGKTNIDLDTGIRYGVISQTSITPETLNDFEPHYPAALDYSDISDLDVSPVGFIYTSEGYSLELPVDQNFIWVFRSEYYTYCKFCSPCVPGAGDLDSPLQHYDGIKTYCLGHDWFDIGVAPYPVYRVSDNSLVVLDSK